MKGDANALRQLVEGMSLGRDGDGNEQAYWPVLAQRFSGYERFWKLVVVPMTKRIENVQDPMARIVRRDGIAEDLWRSSYLNYSLFLHLTYAFEHLSHPQNSSFGNFYTHLGSICDLAEEFLLSVHMLICHCRGEQIPVLQGLSEEDYLTMAKDWYRDEYPKAYQHYLAKGKSKPVYIPPRGRIVSAYTSGTAWKNYAKFAGQIRQYRNKIVHDVAIGNILVGRIHLVPRKEKIGDYSDLATVQRAAQDFEKLKTDFVERTEHMTNDWRQMQEVLDALWAQPIQDITSLLYEQKNAQLAAKYNIQLE